ncbi:flagellar basal body rod protein FlgB [Thermodesulfatator autotrophicus]|uniref:Flagellar basal body rod protein FlgB n=1 Tax=Thermodesulfatator autotrophicus TaxID=1795632 RepID=A0A177E9R4_9BACT|nr:flagellar basal body rod protein FlgB [Thermodesulfatator autotrophicus]OAG28160.1 flagellar biosynthesis protein FlgB [Thermodesulfatator autotrophicus]
MIGVKLFGKTWQVVSEALKLRLTRHEVISANIANVDTPGYRRKDVPFEKVMAAYLKGSPPLKVTNPRHIKPGLAPDGGVPLIEEEPPVEGTPNNVSLEQEMAKLSENNLMYQATVQALMKEIELLREAITEGGKR